ncbi:hypothetical protein MA16_Dca026554 [Dendrobium catenatum]|uniref:Uncharacterized protein n=1 Tax=Dendrobium catenatum TaxID=906689 RepID=A0A2I0WER8_9ASPA|nr:hypothetical protein MA16_Dca026554 [Dendrobium catenatum]
MPTWLSARELIPAAAQSFPMIANHIRGMVQPIAALNVAIQLPLPAFDLKLVFFY